MSNRIQHGNQQGFYLSFFLDKKRNKKILIDIYYFFKGIRESAISRLTDNFGNNVRLSRYILESIITLKTAFELIESFCTSTNLITSPLEYGRSLRLLFYQNSLRPKETLRFYIT